MTERLYYTDAYLLEFDAAVMDRADAGRRVYLDRTAFYPTSGGQACDFGHLGVVEVVDVVDEGSRIAHLLAYPLTDSRVRGRLDWPRRFDHMQQHTGQHLLSAVIAEQLGYATIAVHFGLDTSTIDLDAGTLSPEQLSQLEERANQIAVENRPVSVSFEAAEQVAGLRKPSDRSGDLRIITIQDLDRSACGGTHVRSTGEIGAVLLRKAERVRKGMRLEFLCGHRAVRRARADFTLLSGIAGEFSSPPEDLPRLIQAQRQELKEAKAASRELQSAHDLCRARELYAAAAPDESGIRKVVVRDTGESLEVLRGLGEAFVSLSRTIFVGGVASPPAVVLAASPDSGVDAARVLRGLLATVGGRGGGSASLAQGILPGRAQLDTIVDSIVT